MSYDLLLLRHEPGQSWDEVLEANERRVLEEGDRPLSPAARTRLERIADRLQPTTRGWSAAPPSNTPSWTGRTTLASSGSLAAAWIGPTTSTRSPVATPRCPPGCPECSRTRLRNVVTDPVCGPRRPARRGTRGPAARPICCWPTPPLPRGGRHPGSAALPSCTPRPRRRSAPASPRCACCPARSGASRCGAPGGCGMRG